MSERNIEREYDGAILLMFLSIVLAMFYAGLMYLAAYGVP